MHQQQARPGADREYLRFPGCLCSPPEGVSRILLTIDAALVGAGVALAELLEGVRVLLGGDLLVGRGRRDLLHLRAIIARRVAPRKDDQRRARHRMLPGVRQAGGASTLPHSALRDRRVCGRAPAPLRSADCEEPRSPHRVPRSRALLGAAVLARLLSLLDCRLHGGLGLRARQARAQVPSSTQAPSSPPAQARARAARAPATPLVLPRPLSAWQAARPGGPRTLGSARPTS